MSGCTTVDRMKQTHMIHHDRVRTCSSVANLEGFILPRIYHAVELKTRMQQNDENHPLNFSIHAPRID